MYCSNVIRIVHVTSLTLLCLPGASQVTVLGVAVKPTVVQVAVNGGSPVPHMQFSYSNSNTLTISQLSLNIAQTFTIDFE